MLASHPSASALRHRSRALIKPPLITAVKAQRETSLPPSPAVLITAQRFLSLGLEKVSSPHSLTLFLAIDNWFPSGVSFQADARPPGLPAVPAAGSVSKLANLTFGCMGPSVRFLPWSLSVYLLLLLPTSGMGESHLVSSPLSPPRELHVYLKKGQGIPGVPTLPEVPDASWRGSCSQVGNILLIPMCLLSAWPLISCCPLGSEQVTRQTSGV